MRRFKYILAAFVAQFAIVNIQAQTLPVGTNSLEDYYRRAQLLGEVDSSASFTIRPLLSAKQLGVKNFFTPDSAYLSSAGYKSSEWLQFGKKLQVRILPASILLQENTNHPYGWNDGAMIPARGLQTLISGGLYMQYGILSVQLRPEFISAANSTFDTFNKNHYEVIAAWYHDFYNNIDLPARFGVNSFSRAYWGQSSIRLNYKAFSLGLSTENLWWGPGIRNSLLMSNDAPGFAHLTLNTIKPINTFLGSFEGQLIAGRLKNSNQPPLIPEWEFFNSSVYIPKPDDQRYISGLVLTWHPKWVPGLFLGVTRTAQLYNKDLNGIKDYLPVFNELKSVTGDQAIDYKKDTRSSVFARWLWPEEHAEVYFEYGHNNYTSDLRNVVLEPQDTRAYIAGVRKIVPFANKANGGILVGVEVTELAQTSTDRIADAQSWYINKYVRQGYTNYGQSLGAGIGPGGNLQSVEVSWVKGLKKLGLQIERYLHNDDFYYYAYTRSNDWRRHWVDMSLAANAEWNIGRFIVSGKIMGIKSLNYQWYLDPSKEIVGQPYYVGGRNVYNVQLQAGLTYRF
ncbi:capsule assembly Wzi family protein [Mucilaginibacter sp. RS28]|uniref:Capsule assembly Wzi family protein n=1 Tax=Mucilaginibacter straminoryzae TaxID=2932774 RepID=A0A9X2BBG2_9SPHI|nr:capsule assembly Wzi family protein [Mucilaginibacter straminoryzae]MCJ8209807.1 capsule assembly Wzi family protein [Mucilaginibacter straminoryzae]